MMAFRRRTRAGGQCSTMDRLERFKGWQGPRGDGEHLVCCYVKISEAK